MLAYNAQSFVSVTFSLCFEYYIFIYVSCLWMSILHKKSSFIYFELVQQFIKLLKWLISDSMLFFWVGRSKVNFTFLELDGKPRAEAVSSKLPMLPPGGLAKQFKASTKKTNMWKSWLVGGFGKSVFFLSLRSQQVWWFDRWEVLIFFVWEHLKNMRVVGSWHLVERGPKTDCW